MTRIKQLLSGLSILMFSITLMAQEPQEPDAVYHQLIKEFTIHEDGSYDTHFFKKLELKTPFAFNRLFGETFVVYNPDYQHLKINKAYTIMADGSRNPSPENAFNEVLPRQASNFPAYSHLREMVITHTGLEEGATIYLDYTLNTSAEMFPGFSFYEELRKRVPVEEMKIIVHAPKDYKFEHRVNNLRTAPEIKETEKETTYTWVFKSLPARVREGNVCDNRQQTLAIQGSGSILEQLRLESFSYKLPATLVKTIKTQRDKKEGALNNLMYVFELLEETVDKSHLPQQFAGGLPGSPEKVWQSNVGNTLERTILLAAMVREVGIYAVPVLVMEENELPVLHSDNQIMLHVQIKDGASMLLSADDNSIENHIYSLSGKQYIPLEKGKVNRRTSIPEAKNKYAFHANLTISPDTLFGSGQLDLQHAMNPFFLLQKNNKSLANMVHGMPAYDASLSMLSPASAKGKLEFAAHNTSVLEEQLGQQVFVLPVVKGAVSDWNMTLYDDRISPFEIPYTVSGSTEIILNLENMVCLNNNYELNQEFAFGQVSVNLNVEEGKVVVKKEIILNKKCYNPLEYMELRSALRVFQKEEINKLIIRLKE